MPCVFFIQNCHAGRRTRLAKKSSSLLEEAIWRSCLHIAPSLLSRCGGDEHGQAALSSSITDTNVKVCGSCARSPRDKLLDVRSIESVKCLSSCYLV